MSRIQLVGPQSRQLINAIAGAFSPDELDELALYSLEESVENIAGNKGHRAVTKEVLKYAERHDLVDRLVIDARQLRPTNASLAALASGLQVTPDPALVLQKVLPNQQPLFDPAEFREAMVRVENQVCEISSRSQPLGSGFLVGPDLILTNFHVVARLVGESSPPVEANFDYTAQRSAATPIGLASDWLVDYSRMSPLDEAPIAGQEASSDELDYALLRLEQAFGAEPVNELSSADRGWISLKQEPAIPTNQDDIVIMQHPGGGPRRCAIANYIAANNARTRMTYLTSTESGSSGSPCLTLDWRLVGIHHGGEPGTEPHHNEGIPLGAIVASMQRSGVIDQVG